MRTSALNRLSDLFSELAVKDLKTTHLSSCAAAGHTESELQVTSNIPGQC